MSECGVNNPAVLLPMVQDGFPAGREYRGEFVQALRCPHCAYARFPSPSQELLGEYYSNEYPRSSAGWYNVDADYADWKVKSRADRVEALIRPFGFGPGAVLHEFGCAFGGTVHELNRRGYLASGTELNRGAVEAGRQRGNLAIHAVDAVQYLDGSGMQADVIYSWHAIEHFTEPLQFLDSIVARLKPGGLLVLIAPSAAARFALVYGHSRYVWFGYPEHLHLFSPGSAPSIAKALGVQLIHVSTAEYGIEPEATGRALKCNSRAAHLLKLGDEKLMGEELVMLFRKPSAVDDAIVDVVKRTTLRCDMFAHVERSAMEALESETVDPWGTSPLGKA